MNTTSIVIKTHFEKKKEAKKTAQQLGYSLNALVHSFLKQFVKTQKITLSDAPLVDEETEKQIAKSLEDRKAGRYTIVKNTKELKTYLQSL